MRKRKKSFSNILDYLNMLSREEYYKSYEELSKEERKEIYFLFLEGVDVNFEIVRS